MPQQKEWTTEQFIYIRWCAIPVGSRDKKVDTQAKIAEQLGKSPRTLLTWKKLDGFQDAVFAEVRRNLDWRLPEILKALGDEAEEGNISAIKLVLELTGRYQESQRVDFYDREYGVDEMKKAAEEIQKYEEERFGKPGAGGGSETGEGGEGAGET